VPAFAVESLRLGAVDEGDTSQEMLLLLL